MTRKLLAAALASLLLAAAPGCVHYHLGSMLPPDIQTVFVPTVENQTTEPFLEQDVTSAVISQIQMDGSLKIADEDKADTILEIVLSRFWLVPVSYVSKAASSANEYRMNITASIVLRRLSDDSIVLESPSITGHEDFEYTGDITSAKAIALRPTAEDLGRRIVNELVMYWPEHDD